jgi:hypothetical protein
MDVLDRLSPSSISHNRTTVCSGDGKATSLIKKTICAAVAQMIRMRKSGRRNSRVFLIKLISLILFVIKLFGY